MSVNEREAKQANGFHVVPIPIPDRQSEPEFKELGGRRAERALKRWHQRNPKGYPEP